MVAKPKLKLGLTAYENLFKDANGLAETKLPKIYDIPIELIDDFPDHPFKVRHSYDSIRRGKQRVTCSLISCYILL